MKVQKQIILVLLGICMTMLMAGCDDRRGSIISENRAGAPVASTEQDSIAQTEEESSEDASDVYGICEVMAVDTTTSTIKFYNIKKAKQETYTYNDGTYFLDKYGEYTSVSKMVPGKMVQIQLSKQTKELTQVQISDKAWEYDDIKKFAIDEENSMITIAGDKYYYKGNLNVFSEENVVELSDISDKDVLRIQGIGKEIFTISITSGHGVIQLTNTSLFEGGWLSLGTKIYLQVTSNMQIEMPEGTYLLSVANNGYGDTKEITVNRGEATTVDLNELKGEGPQYCNITFEVGVANAVMTIDGEIVDYTKPLEVKYGIHKLEIVADGYDAWSKKLYVNSKEATIQVAMTEEATETSSTETTEKNSTTSSQSSSAKSTASTSTKSTGSTSSTSSTSTSSTSDANSSYLKTLSDIISTLTDNSSSSD